MKYTQKQIDKFNRQKYITELEKISKNLFRMFKSDSIKVDIFKNNFQGLQDKLALKTEVHLDSEYHRELKNYLHRLYGETCKSIDFKQKNLDEIKEAEMSNLNRLQKLKNATSYKKDKHKAQSKNEDWG